LDNEIYFVLGGKLWFIRNNRLSHKIFKVYL